MQNLKGNPTLLSEVRQAKEEGIKI